MAETSTTMLVQSQQLYTSLATTDNVTSLSPDAVIEMSPSSNEVSLAVGKEAVDSVNMETAPSSDLPREAIDRAKETSHSKMKLQRQDAVAEEKDETPLKPAVVRSQPSGKFDDIAISFSELTIGNIFYVCVCMISCIAYNVISPIRIVWVPIYY